MIDASEDKKRLQQLQNLVDAAANEADKWKGEQNWRDPTEEEYNNYRNRCYSIIWELFWRVANQITIAPEDYYSDSSYEDDMRAYLEAHRHTNWIIAAIVPKPGEAAQ